MEHWLWMILMAFLYKGSCEESISPLSDSVLALEGESVTLSCNFSERVTSLFWYQQRPRSPPRFLMTDYSKNTSHLSTNHDKVKQRFHLIINSVELTDSALYYCALQPTLTQTTHTAEQKLHHHFTAVGSLFLKPSAEGSTIKKTLVSYTCTDHVI